ncbi:hypothetical protein FCR2A7T_01560 [Flavobacterium cauense R2A-7]|uniref:Protein-disulfide isomerase n=1 Tax=Flavobacterium cauense R2A-7 TaxID=1341154 RepID=V6S500_9FLAO|nr:vitamin K epoxide reductase family protein [Flavobacterium cauense]ESU21701.1 hypothetical protein FCR2A7T_01560 [Flavobacterium cauense R2A-7]KGO80938.1 hypothetical protein Q762_09830 [Flavobacterium cauense R2A-7]TWI12847.1 protein-disulfide isomerase [Flavobacterium cauense R2A-7]
MSVNFTFFFQYLKKEKIAIDEDEFDFQIQSHPYYPSLLAVSDTLGFFKINNLTARIENDDLEHLPDNFIGLIKNEDPVPAMAHIERTKTGYRYTQNKKPVILSKQAFQDVFQNIVLIAEKEEDVVVSKKINNFRNLGLWIFGMLYVVLILMNTISILSGLFLFFGLIGLFLSVEAISYEFGIKTKFSEAVCSIAENTDCNVVITSQKSKILEHFRFSDASITFFGAQLLCLLFFSISNQLDSFFSISMTLLIVSLPITLISLYQQIVVVKKICPMCMVIIGLLYSEIIALYFFKESQWKFNFQMVLYYTTILLGLYLTVFFVKKTMKDNLNLQSEIVKSNRFKRNYSLFKIALLSSDTVSDKSNEVRRVFLGNPEANLKIILVSSPFCAHCKEAHKILEEVLERFGDKVVFDLRFNYDEKGNENAKKIHYKLMRIYFDEGQESFLKALHNWFETKEETKLISKVAQQITDLQISELLREQLTWNRNNQITFVPAIIINGYHFPVQYDRNSLIHFIEDLANDVPV